MRVLSICTLLFISFNAPSFAQIDGSLKYHDVDNCTKPLIVVASNTNSDDDDDFKKCDAKCESEFQSCIRKARGHDENQKCADKWRVCQGKC